MAESTSTTYVIPTERFMSAVAAVSSAPTPAASQLPILRTPDSRYIVVRGRLWRASNPSLAPEFREKLVQELMDARRALRSTGDEHSKSVMRARVDAAKRGLGERGPVWWMDGEPDYNRRLAKNTPYAQWHEQLTGGVRNNW